jgi:hypothetical protein
MNDSLLKEDNADLLKRLAERVYPQSTLAMVGNPGCQAAIPNWTGAAQVGHVVGGTFTIGGPDVLIQEAIAEIERLKADLAEAEECLAETGEALAVEGTAHDAVKAELAEALRSLSEAVQQRDEARDGHSLIGYWRERADKMDAYAGELEEVVNAFIAETVDYMTRNKLGDPEKQHNVKWGRAVLAKNADDIGPPMPGVYRDGLGNTKVIPESAGNEISGQRVHAATELRLAAAACQRNAENGAITTSVEGLAGMAKLMDAAADVLDPLST